MSDNGPEKTSRPRLLIISGYWPSIANRISGLFIVQQAAAFIRAGYELDVAVPVTRGRRQSPLCSFDEVGLPPSGGRLIEMGVFRVPEQLSSLPGVLGLNSLLAGRAVSRLARRLRESARWSGCIIHGIRYAGLSLPAWHHDVAAPAIIVLHGVEPFFRTGRNAEHARPLIRRAAENAASVVLVGNPLRAHASALGVPDARISVIGNGTEVTPRVSGAPQQRGVTQTRRIVSVSNLIQVKGIDLNLRALSLVHSRHPTVDWEYRVVGDGPCRKDLEALAATLGIGARVQFLGRVPYGEAMREVGEADIFSLPSWEEAFGIVYLEAMARCRPVIGCLENGPADFVVSERNGLLVAPRAVEDLARALQRLISDPGLCGQLGREARRTAEDHSWDTNARRMLSLLDGSTERMTKCV